jgi:hypothetical protein
MKHLYVSETTLNETEATLDSLRLYLFDWSIPRTQAGCRRTLVTWAQGSCECRRWCF